MAIGSHDLVLDLAASRLRADDPTVTLASTNAGSLGGLAALRDGLCHLAGSHLLDPDSGGYTLPFVERVLPGRDLAVIRLVHREQGLIVAPGNPLRPHRAWPIWPAPARATSTASAARAPGCCSITSCRRRGVTPEAVQGYEREEHTHLAVAAAVAAGRADCGLGVLAAARAFELDFVPVAREPYDLVLERATVDHPLLAPLWALLASPAFGAAVESLGGYDTAEMGRRIV